jgi:hypothetical protein
VRRREAKRYADDNQQRELENGQPFKRGKQLSDSDDDGRVEHIDGKRVVGQRFDKLILRIAFLSENRNQPSRDGDGRERLPKCIGGVFPIEAAVDTMPSGRSSM